LVCTTEYSIVSFARTVKVFVLEQLATLPADVLVLFTVQLIEVLPPLWRTTNVVVSDAEPAW
jgi:hypothetical protein